MKKHGRKVIFSAALILALSTPSFAAARKQGTFEFYLGNYDIKDARFKEVYEKGDAIRGIVLSSALAYGFDFYTEIKAFYKTGALTYTREETKFLLLPLSLGLRFVLPGSYVLPYAGGGVDFLFYYETNPIAKTMNIAKGYHLLAGIYLQFGENSPLRLNAKVKYTRSRTTEDGVEIELGGMEYGGGIAIVF
jgi:hypothetical protein